MLRLPISRLIRPSIHVSSRSYAKESRQFFRLRTHKINVPKNVKLELILNDISVGSIQKNITEDYKDVTQNTAFYQLPIKLKTTGSKQEDSILCIYGPTEYDTAIHTISILQTLRNQVLKNQSEFTKDKLDISEMDLCYRMRIIVHASYASEIRSRKYNWAAYSRGKGVINWEYYGTKMDKILRKRSESSDIR